MLPPPDFVAEIALRLFTNWSNAALSSRAESGEKLNVTEPSMRFNVRCVDDMSLLSRVCDKTILPEWVIGIGNEDIGAGRAHGVGQGGDMGQGGATA